MASLDELEGSSSIKELLDTVAQVVMPNKEFSSPSLGGSTPNISTPNISTPTFGPTLRPSVPGVGTPGVGTPGAGSSPEGGAPRQANNSGDPSSRADAEAKSKDPSTRNKLIAAGVAAAIVASILAVALSRYLASAGAEISFKRIVPEKTTLLGYTIGTPTKVGVTWSVKKPGPGGLASNVKVLKDDDIEWHDSTIDTLDGTDVPVTKVKGDKEFVVESKKSDSSTIDLTDKGYGVIKTSFDAHVDQAVADAGAGTADLLGDFLGGLTDIDFGAWLIVGLGILLVVLVGPIVIDIIKGFTTKSNNRGSGNS